MTVMADSDVSKDQLLLNEKPIAGTLFSIQIRDESIQVSELSRGLSFSFQIKSPSVAFIIQEQGARPTCVRIVSGPLLGYIHDTRSHLYTGTVLSLKFGFTRKYGATVFSLAGYARHDHNTRLLRSDDELFSFQISFEISDQEVRSYCFDNSVFRAINSFVDDMIKAELLDRTQPQFKGIEVIVRPIRADSFDYLFTLTNYGDQTLPSVSINPDAILEPECFGWDSTHFPRQRSIEVGQLNPGQTVTVTGRAAGPASLYRGGWRRIVLGSDESVRAHRAMRVFVQMSALS